MNVKPIPLGTRFGALTVIGQTIENRFNKWICLCDCGNECKVRGYALRHGNNISCGCATTEWRYQFKKLSAVGAKASAAVQLKHGHSTRSKGESPTYCAWASMIQRCTNPNVRYWHVYGGRGITVCERWRNSFENFLTDMGERPSLKHSLGRILDMTNYDGPENVFWQTKEEQSLAKLNHAFLKAWQSGRPYTIQNNGKGIRIAYSASEGGNGVRSNSMDELL